MDRLSYIRIQMHWVNKIHIRILVLQILDGSHHVDEAFTEVLTAMTGNQHQFSAVSQTVYIITSLLEDTLLLLRQRLIVLQLIYHHVQGINHGISSYVNFTLRFLFLEIAFRKRSWRKVVVGNTASNLSVHLLRPWRVDVVGTKASLYMPYRNLLIECSQGGSCRCSSITMYQYHIRLALLEHISHTCQYPGGNIIQVLSLLHDIEVEVWLHLKDVQHLVKHFSMLTCYANDGLKLIAVFLKFLHQRAHLDGLRSGSKD